LGSFYLGVELTPNPISPLVISLLLVGVDSLVVAELRKVLSICCDFLNSCRQ